MGLKQELAEKLERHGQGHLLQFWDDLDDGRRKLLATEIASIDFEQLDRLVAEHVHGDEAAGEIQPDGVDPIDVVRMPQTDAERSARRRATEAGEEALAAGEVGVILVAGGSGTRLGFAGPKGTFPIGPVSSASLFQIHAEKVLRAEVAAPALAHQSFGFGQPAAGREQKKKRQIGRGFA